MKVRILDISRTSENLKRMCRDKGLNAGDISKVMQFNSTQSVYKWFSGKSSCIPSLDHLIILGMLLDCYIDDILVVYDVDVDVGEN